MLWEVALVLLCPTMDLSQCITVANTEGPYKSEEACLVRAQEIFDTWPPLVAMHYGTPTVGIRFGEKGDPRCAPLGVST